MSSQIIFTYIIIVFEGLLDVYCDSLALVCLELLNTGLYHPAEVRVGGAALHELLLVQTAAPIHVHRLEYILGVLLGVLSRYVLQVVECDNYLYQLIQFN